MKLRIFPLLLIALGCAMSACGSSSPVSGDATSAVLHCAPATAKPDDSAAQAAGATTRTAALCAPSPERHS